ncbi:MAG: M48 family metalloprotease, partial [Firmicutes bacterium]|nr:M48 family metalloprotease [Bacillota bacterium]
MNNFSKSVWFTLTLAVAFLLLTWLWASLAPRGISPEASRYFTLDFIRRARGYQETRYLTYGLAFLLEVLVLTLLSFTPLGKGLENLVQSLAGGRPYREVFYFLLIIFGGAALLSLPLSYYRGFILEHAYGLSNQSTLDWLKDYFLSTAISLALTVPTLAGFYFLVRRFPQSWPWLVAGIYTAGMALLIMLSPLLIDPLFYHFRPVQDPQIRQQVLDLAAKAGIPVEEVLEMDASRRTNKVNAYFTGLGQTKRIVLYDNLLKKYPPTEVKLVVAHEMGHWRYAHIWKGLLLGGLGTLFTLLLLQKVLAGMKGFPSLHPVLRPSGLLLIFLFLTLWLFISQP